MAPVTTVAGESLERYGKKFRKFGERLDSLEERHSMRKALKKLRYDCEFFQTHYKALEKRCRSCSELSMTPDG